MEGLQIFNSEEFGQIRTIEENGKIMFCGNDVAAALGYADTPKAIKTHCKSGGWAICPVTDNLGRTQQAKFIDEGNLYRLITHSKLESAERFESWVFDEVLPTLRKTGTYEMPKKEKQEKPKKKNLSSANMLVKTVSGIFKDAGVDPLYIAAEAKRLYKEQADIDIMIPLVTDKETMPKLYDCTEIAKELGILSNSGNPHNQAVSAIIKKLNVSDSEIVTTAFSRNGHDDVTTQYKPSVFEDVKRWLEENGYPTKIPYVDSKGNQKTCTVVYAEVA